MITGISHQVTMEEVTDPARIAQARAQRQRFDRNWAWFEARAADIYQQHRGRFLAVAGQELFVGDTVQGVLAQARAVHPEDDGLFTRYIPRERMLRIYAHQRALAFVR
jgi:hypothetical protein